MKQYYIYSFHEVCQDDYENGEGPICNSYTMDRTIQAESLREALKIYIDELYLHVDLLNGVEINENFICTSVQVDENNLPPSKLEVEQWKRGRVKLFNQYIIIKAKKMQDINFENELLTLI